MNEDKILNLLGLAQRAGKVISGDFIVEKAIKRKELKEIYSISRNISDSTS